MIKVINSKELKGSADLVCCHCGQELNARMPNGNSYYKEGEDYVFETDGKDEWCICAVCKENLDEKKSKIEMIEEEKQHNLERATINYFEDIAKYEGCKYGKLQYDPNLYKQAIFNIIDLAKRNGIRVNCFDEILEIENVTSKDKQTINLTNIYTEK